MDHLGCQRTEVKAAWGCRTPQPREMSGAQGFAPAFWSAAAPCRFWRPIGGRSSFSGFILVRLESLIPLTSTARRYFEPLRTNLFRTTWKSSLPATMRIGFAPFTMECGGKLARRRFGLGGRWWNGQKRRRRCALPAHSIDFMICRDGIGDHRTSRFRGRRRR